MSAQLTIEDLNGDCLDHIFQYLELIDIVRLHKLSKTFQSSIQRWFTKHTITDGDLLYSIHFETNIEPIRFLNEFGQYLKRFEIFSHDSKLNDKLPTLCTNLEHMTIVFYKSEPEMPHLSFLKRMRPLRIELNTPQPHIAKYIEKPHFVESLHLHKCLFTDKDKQELHKLTKLRKFRMSESFISSEIFIHILRTNPDLTNISMASCSGIGRKVFEYLTQQSKWLDLLEIDADDENIPTGVVYVKHLKIRYAWGAETSATILRQYARYDGNHLITLSCICWREFYFPEDVFFPQLRELHLDYCEMSQADDNFKMLLKKSCPRLKIVKINDYGPFQPTKCFKW